MKLIPCEQLVETVHIKLQAKVKSRDDKQIEKTAFKLNSYIAKDENSSLEDTNKLIHDLERSLLCLRRKKEKIVRGKTKKIK